MLLAIDIGNSNIVLGLFDQEKLIAKWRLLSNTQKSADDFAIDIIELFLTQKIDINAVSGCIIASVVPDLSDTIKESASKFFQGKTVILDQNNQNLNIEVKLKNKKEVGTDRLINGIAGFHYFGGNLTIIDFGTATTFDIIDENGAYIGGVIAPGPNLSLQSLQQATAKLPKIEIKKQDHIIGKNTVEAMNSGIYYGYISLIEGVLKRIDTELKTKTTKIITGGLAELFKDELEITHHKDNLTLDGLRLVYNNNIGQQN